MADIDRRETRTDSRPVIDHTLLNLNEWLKIVLTPEEDRTVRTQVCCFPTDELLREFLLNVDIVSDVEFRHLLRSLLVGSGTYGFDHRNFKFLLAGNGASLLGESEYLRRLMTGQNAWEGIHWVLDLLPHSPKKAIEVIEIFALRFCQQFSDGFLNGLDDATTIIKAKYIRRDHHPSVLLDLTPREFEFLAYELFKAMGYEVIHTGGSGDGGIDVRASKRQTGQREEVFIQCKLVRGRIGVAPLRELFGVVETYRASRCVLMTNSEFTQAALRETDMRGHRVELLGFTALDGLLNEHFGSQWPIRLPALVSQANKRRPH